MKENKKNLIIVLVLLITVVAVAIGMGNWFNYRAIEFPYSLKSGKLVVNSLFQASIENPDCSNEIGDNTASLEIVNKSDKYCEEAEIFVKMKDGSRFLFKIFDIPAGKTVWAFDLENQSVIEEGQCVDVDCKAKFRDETASLEDIEYEVNDTVIIVRNLTDRNLENLSVYYHCLFDEAYYGGTSYCKRIDNLPANEVIQLQTDECYMGIAEVVNIVKE